MPERWIEELRRLRAVEPNVGELWSRIETRLPLGAADRRLSRAAVTVLVLSLFGAAFAGLWIGFRQVRSTEPIVGPTPSLSPAAPSNYVLTDLRFTRGGPGWVQVSFRASWERPDLFPGVHRCTWEALNATGKVIGTRWAFFYSTTSNSRTQFVNVGADGSPEKVRGRCHPRRLDVGAPYEYDFGDVGVVPDPDRDSSPIMVGSRLRWVGPGPLGVVLCDVRVRNADGEVIGHRRNLLLPGGSRVISQHFDLPGLLVVVSIADPDPSPEEIQRMSASYQCRPLG